MGRARAKPLALIAVILVLCLRTGLAQEMAILAQAETFCALDTNYFVALEALNDSSDSSVQPLYDYIDDRGGSYVIRWWEGRFLPQRVALLSAPLPWKGPYVTFQSGRTQTTDSPYDRGSPLDPWGNPYYFFSPLGLLRGDSGSVTLELYGDSFDRYTIVSLGPDGVLSQDDLNYQFGPAVTATAISSLGGPRTVRLSAGPFANRPAGSTTPDYFVAAGAPLVVRGVNLFNAEGESEVWWGTIRFNDILSTSPREIVLQTPPQCEGMESLYVRVPGGGESNRVLLSISSVTTASDWQLFE